MQSWAGISVSDLYVAGLTEPDELELRMLSWEPCEPRCQPFDRTVGFIQFFKLKGCEGWEGSTAEGLPEAILLNY